MFNLLVYVAIALFIVSYYFIINFYNYSSFCIIYPNINKRIYFIYLHYYNSNVKVVIPFIYSKFHILYFTITKLLNFINYLSSFIIFRLIIGKNHIFIFYNYIIYNYNYNFYKYNLSIKYLYNTSLITIHIYIHILIFIFYFACLLFVSKIIISHLFIFIIFNFVYIHIQNYFILVIKYCCFGFEHLSYLHNYYCILIFIAILYFLLYNLFFEDNSYFDYYYITNSFNDTYINTFYSFEYKLIHFNITDFYCFSSIYKVWFKLDILLSFMRHNISLLYNFIYLTKHYYYILDFVLYPYEIPFYLIHNISISINSNFLIYLLSIIKFNLFSSYRVINVYIHYFYYNYILNLNFIITLLVYNSYFKHMLVDSYHYYNFIYYYSSFIIFFEKQNNFTYYYKSTSLSYTLNNISFFNSNIKLNSTNNYNTYTYLIKFTLQYIILNLLKYNYLLHILSYTILIIHNY